MARASYKIRAIVLRKTKLGEADLILTLLASDGSQLRAVARGARKPSNTFSARLELYSIVEILCSEGKSLDIIKEARLLQSNERLRCDINYAAGAAPMVELLDKVTQIGLTDERFFEMTEVAFSALERVRSSMIPALCAAHLLKTLAFAGLRPSLKVCVCCGKTTDPDGSGEYARISSREGGMICDVCAADFDTILMSQAVISWVNYLLTSSFADIEKEDIDLRASFEVLHFCQSWTKEHIGTQLKSLNFIFTCGLYE